MLSRRAFLRLLPAGLSAFLISATAPVVQAMNRPRVTRYALTPENWPAGLKLKLCVIADIHACDPWMTPARVREICEIANGLSPDAMLLLGDYVSSMPNVSEDVPTESWADHLARLVSPLGTHAVLGNHDYWHDVDFQRDPARGTCASQTALEKVGIPVYINRAVKLQKDGQPFWLAGLGDQAAIRHDPMRGRHGMSGLDDLKATLAATDHDGPVILMAHEPDIFKRVGRDVALTLCGHTHGGQVNLFGWRPRSASPGSARYPQGHFHENGRDLIVSQGLGCSELPIRIGCHPEILLIELG